MKLDQEIFTIKLWELKRQFRQMEERVQLCQQQDHGEVRRQLQQTLRECRETQKTLVQKVTGCRSPAVASLAEAQLKYQQRTDEIFQKELVQDVHSEGASPLQDRAEAAALYAEYAIDFAVQSMRHAMAAALQAVDVELNLEEKEASHDA